VAAGNPQMGEQVRRAAGGFGLVQPLMAEGDTALIYNLIVAGAHAYVVGEQQALAHNNCDF
jgi:hypothetical protein